MRISCFSHQKQMNSIASKTKSFSQTSKIPLIMTQNFPANTLKHQPPHYHPKPKKQTLKDAISINNIKLKFSQIIGNHNQTTPQNNSSHTRKRMSIESRGWTYGEGLKKSKQKGKSLIRHYQKEEEKKVKQQAIQLAASDGSQYYYKGSFKPQQDCCPKMKSSQSNIFRSTNPLKSEIIEKIRTEKNDKFHVIKKRSNIANHWNKNKTQASQKISPQDNRRLKTQNQEDKLFRINTYKKKEKNFYEEKLCQWDQEADKKKQYRIEPWEIEDLIDSSQIYGES